LTRHNNVIPSLHHIFPTAQHSTSVTGIPYHALCRTTHLRHVSSGAWRRCFTCPRARHLAFYLKWLQNSQCFFSLTLHP